MELNESINIEFRREKDYCPYTNFEVFYCPSIINEKQGTTTAHFAFRQGGYTNSWMKSGSLKNSVSTITDKNVVILLRKCYDKLIKDEQFAIYKEEIIQWYIRINLLSEIIIPDIIIYIKTLI